MDDVVAIEPWQSPDFEIVLVNCEVASYACGDLIVGNEDT